MDNDPNHDLQQNRFRASLLAATLAKNINYLEPATSILTMVQSSP